MLNFEHVVSIQLGYAAAYLERVPMCTRRFETRYQVYVQIQCNTGTYSQTFFPSAIRLWNTLPVDICQLSPDSFKTHLSSFCFIWAPDYVLFLSPALHCFLLEVTVHCLLHGFLDTHLIIHSWCDIARNRVGTFIGRWRYKIMILTRCDYHSFTRFFCCCMPFV